MGLTLEKNWIYLASPWFNSTQSEREIRIKTRLTDLGFNVWSPRDNSVALQSTINEPKVREMVFESNIANIVNANIIFAITDEKDIGTIWEAGFAYGIREMMDYFLSSMAGDVAKDVVRQTIVYYCETLGGAPFNLMLAQSGDIIITSYEGLDKLPSLILGKETLPYDGTIE